MRSIHLCFFIPVICLSLFAQDRKPRIGVLDFTAAGVSASDAQVVGEMFRGETVNSGAFEVLDRNNMNSIMKEQQLQMSGCTESACAVQIGRLLNMEYMLYGSLSKLGSVFIIQVSMANIETAQIVVSTKEKFPAIENADEAINRIVNNLKWKVADYQRELLQKRRERGLADPPRTEPKKAGNPVASEPKKEDKTAGAKTTIRTAAGGTEWSTLKWTVLFSTAGALAAGGTLNILGALQQSGAESYYASTYMTESGGALSVYDTKYTTYQGMITAGNIENIIAYSLYGVAAALAVWWFFIPDVPAMKDASILPSVSPVFAENGALDGASLAFTWRW